MLFWVSSRAWCIYWIPRSKSSRAWSCSKALGEALANTRPSRKPFTPKACRPSWDPSSDRSKVVTRSDTSNALESPKPGCCALGSPSHSSWFSQDRHQSLFFSPPTLQCWYLGVIVFIAFPKGHQKRMFFPSSFSFSPYAALLVVGCFSFYHFPRRTPKGDVFFLPFLFRPPPPP